jgi:hypothetical protein
MEQALEFVRSIQKTAFEHGLNLSLGGGVLNTGFSMKDLDIVACPAKDMRLVKTDIFLKHVAATHKLTETNRKTWNTWMTLVGFKDSSNRRIEFFVVNT